MDSTTIATIARVVLNLYTRVLILMLASFVNMVLFIIISYFILVVLTSRSVQADVVISWFTSSGFQVGFWLLSLKEVMSSLGIFSPTGFLFRDVFSGKRWTSRHFRLTHLYPLLELQRLEGDIFLQCIDPSVSARSVESLFYSMHSYRRGARTHCSKKRLHCARAATPLEVYNHARWRF